MPRPGRGIVRCMNNISDDTLNDLYRALQKALERHRFYVLNEPLPLGDTVADEWRTKVMQSKVAYDQALSRYNAAREIQARVALALRNA